jgi:hypothetical protein
MAYIVDFALTESTSGATSFSPNVPTHEADDYLLVIFSADSGTLGCTGYTAIGTAQAANAAITTALFYKKAASAAETITCTMNVADAYTVCVLCVRDADPTTFIDVSSTTNSGATATSTPSNIAVTTTTADCLLIYALGMDGIATQSHSNPGVHFLISHDSGGTTATTSAAQAVSWYIQRTAGTTPVASWINSASSVHNFATVAIRNRSGGVIPAYVDDSTLPGTSMIVGHHFSTLNNLTFQAPTITNIGPAGTGRAVTSDAYAATADYGLNPYSAALSSTPSTTAATAASGYEVLFTNTHDVTTDFIVGTIIASTPKMANYNHGSVKQGGTWLVAGDNSNYYHSFQILGRDSSPNTEGRAVFSVQPNQGGTVDGFSSTTIATYASSNQSGVTSLYGASTYSAGQSFAGTGVQLSVVRLWLKKTGLPEGFAYVKIYAHSGTLGTSSVPTGSYLAISEPVNVEKLTTSYANVDFKINTAFTPTNAVNYVFAVEFTGGSVGNTLDVGTDTSAPTAPTGNFATLTGTTWTAVSGTDMIYTLYRAPVLSALKKLQINFNCPTATITEYIAEVHRARTHIVAGGTSTKPVDSEGLAQIGKSFRVPLLQKTGAAGILAYVPIQIGGGDAVNFQIDAGSLQFPRRYDINSKQINFHAAPNAIGISYAGKTGDVIKHTNSVVTSASPYYWEVNSAATSAATWDFAGLTVVNAKVTLRNVMTFTDMTFVSFQSVDTSGCSLLNCSFAKAPTISASITFDSTTLPTSSYLITTGSLSIFSNCTFVGSGTSGHGIRITTPGTYTFSNIQWTGYGGTTGDNLTQNSGSTSAFILNESGGTVTISLTNGSDTPSIRNVGTGSITYASQSKTFTISNVVYNSELRLFKKSDGTELAGVENIGVTSPTGGSVSGPDSNGRYTFSFGHSLNETINVVVINITDLGAPAISYQPVFQEYTLNTGADQSFLVSQVLDRQYANPT